MNLMVISDFEHHKRGDVISDALAVDLVLQSQHAHCVVAISSDPQPADPASAALSIPVED